VGIIISQLGCFVPKFGVKACQASLNAHPVGLLRRVSKFLNEYKQDGGSGYTLFIGLVIVDRNAIPTVRSCEMRNQTGEWGF